MSLVQSERKHKVYITKQKLFKFLKIYNILPHLNHTSFVYPFNILEDQILKGLTFILGT